MAGDQESDREREVSQAQEYRAMTMLKLNGVLCLAGPGPHAGHHSEGEEVQQPDEGVRRVRRQGEISAPPTSCCHHLHHENSLSFR